MRYKFLPILIAATLLVLSACGSINTSPIDDPAPAAPQEAKSSQLAVCPVTQPPEAAFVPPEPWPSQPPRENHFWFGDRGLWTSLPADGSWGQLALGEKFFWWSDEFDVTQDDTPDLQVTARHLDGEQVVGIQDLVLGRGERSQASGAFENQDALVQDHNGARARSKGGLPTLVL